MRINIEEYNGHHLNFPLQFFWRSPCWVPTDPQGLGGTGDHAVRVGSPEAEGGETAAQAAQGLVRWTWRFFWMGILEGFNGIWWGFGRGLFSDWDLIAGFFWNFSRNFSRDWMDLNGIQQSTMGILLQFTLRCHPTVTSKFPQLYDQLPASQTSMPRPHRYLPASHAWWERNGDPTFSQVNWVLIKVI